MDATVDHYTVLGLPSGEEGANLTDKGINNAYKLKALELHPDKRPDDPNATSNFQQLRTSYDILKDEKARKLFDDLLRVNPSAMENAAKWFPISSRESAMRRSGGKKRLGLSSNISVGGRGIDQEKALKVSWERNGEDYSAEKLMELFSTLLSKGGRKRVLHLLLGLLNKEL